MRDAEANRLSREVPQALLDRGCVLWLRDLRSDTLPRHLRTFLAEHFQPLDGDLSLWGQRFHSPVRATFLASRDDRYFVDPPDAVKGGLRIDDRPVSSVTFSLTAGPHSVEYSGPLRSIYLLWLPRDGKTWSPKQGLPRTFSWLF